jgi:hypothetical protein
MAKDELFQTGDQQGIWQKYCGFLDLSLAEFMEIMEIQEQLLMDQIDLVYDSPLARKFLPKKPKDESEFRRLVPLTTYEDYAPYLGNCQEDVLAGKPNYWAHTSGRGGNFKWAPFARRADEIVCRNMIGAWILASAKQKGEVNVQPGGRMLFNLPGRPYFSGYLAFSLSQRISFPIIPPLEEAEGMEFKERIEKGFEIALRTGVDFLASMSSVLIKIGEDFSERSGNMKFSRSMLHPFILFRLLRALLRCKLVEKRGLLPKDLWPVKAVFAWGTDTSIYREQISYYWGKMPYEIYGATESGVIAMQSWTKKWMTFLADTVFLEFIPEAEWLKSKEDKEYQPTTVLLNEVEEGKIYEIVVTDFYGMPFLRYRLGDLIKIVALRDDETGINLPQMVFQARADDIIDIAGFTRLDEKTVWQAIVNTGIRYEDWAMRKEYEQDKPVLYLYIELKKNMEAKEVERLIHEQLKAINRDYKDLVSMLETKPLRVKLLSKGTFQRYLEEKQRAGVDLAHLKPPHMNASDTLIGELVLLSAKEQV